MATKLDRLETYGGEEDLTHQVTCPFDKVVMRKRKKLVTALVQYRWPPNLSGCGFKEGGPHQPLQTQQTNC